MSPRAPVCRRFPSFSGPTFLVAALVAGLALPGCASEGGGWVEIGGARYQVEVADDDA